MKYYYEKPDLYFPLYGKTIFLNDELCRSGTLFENNGKGILVVQPRNRAQCITFEFIDPWLANDIYLNPGFPDFFKANASTRPFPIIHVRKVMWALRMKPLKREEWENFL